MAAPVSAQQLLGLLRDHRLLEPAQLQQLMARSPAELGDARKLAGDLVRQGWLTPFQINQIFQGRIAELILGPYLLLERIGEGAMGQVFKARHLRLDRLASIKTIRPDRLANTEAVQRFQREARGAARLSHPNIVTIYDADQANGIHYLAMEFVEGTDLDRLMKQSGFLPVEQACSYARQAALGLQHIHEAGLVHRDIKPTNILVTTRGNVVKILDLGLARWDEPAENDLLTQEGTVIGTLDYLSPEQALDSRKADSRADIYSLGCTLYFLLTGQPPFPGGSPVQKIASHQQKEPTPLAQFRPDLPAGVQAVVSKMMAKRPEDRFQIPVDVAAALVPFSDVIGVSSSLHSNEGSWSVPMQELVKDDGGSVPIKEEKPEFAGSFSVPLSTFEPAPELQPPPPTTAKKSELFIPVEASIIAPAADLQHGIATKLPIETRADDTFRPGSTVFPPPGSVPTAPQGGSHILRWLVVAVLLIGAGAASYWVFVIMPQLQADHFFAEGQRHLKEGEFDQAISDFNEVLKRDSKNAAANRELAIAFNAKKDYESAQAKATRAIGLDSKDWSAYRERGRAFAHQQKFDQARSDFSAALKLKADDPLTRLYRGQMLLRQGQADDALADFSEALKIDDKLAEAHAGRGQVLNRQGQWKDALAAFERAIAIDAKHAPAWSGKAMTLWCYNRPSQQMLDAALEAEKLDGKLASARAWHGVASAALNDFTTAVAECDKAVQLAPGSGEPSMCRGIVYTIKKVPPKALADFDEALKHDPQLALVYYVRGRFYFLVERKYDLAIAECDKALAAGLKCANVYRLRGASLAHVKDQLDKGLADFAEAIRLDADERQNYVQRAVVYRDHKMLDKAIADYDTLITTDAKDAEAYNLRGKIYAIRHEWDKALADFDKCLSLDPKNLNAHFQRAFAFRDQQQPDKAIAEYNAILAKNPKTWQAFYDRGLIHAAEKNFDAAIKDFDLAASINSSFAAIFQQRGEAYTAKNDLDKAIADYDQAVKLNPNNDFWPRNLAMLYIRHNQATKAIDIYTARIKRNPKDHVSYNLRGNIHKTRLEYKLALADYAEAIRINPDFLTPHSNTAWIYRLQKEPKKAIEEYSKIIVKAPKNFDAHLERGIVRAGLKEYDLAVQDFEIAGKLRPKMVAVHRQLADLYRGRKDYVKSIAAWTDAIDLDQKDATLYDNRGWDYLQVSDLVKALFDFDEAIKLDPNLVQPYRNRAIVHRKKGEKVKAKADDDIADALMRGMTAQEFHDGFVSIFNGKDLDDWNGPKRGYKVENGLLVCLKLIPDTGKPNFGNIYTDQEFGDFIFRFDFKLEPGTNNGVSVRGEEIQILDDYAPENRKLRPAEYHGSIYNKVPAKRGHTRPAGEWNTQEIMVKGREWKVTVNGFVILDVDIAKQKLMASKARFTRAPLGFLAHGGKVEFRHLRVKELK